MFHFMKTPRSLLDEMFREMVLTKDASKIAKFYARDFLLFTNGTTMDYDQYVAMHERVYATPIQYEYRIDNETVIETDGSIGARVFITTQMPGEAPREIEVVLLAKYRDGLLVRLWELTWPDWTKAKEFQ
jgi:hypothetical protein